MPVKISDRKRWERELTDHMRHHAADIPDPPRESSEAGMWISARRFYLWTILVMIITSVGWAIGLYAF